MPGMQRILYHENNATAASTRTQKAQEGRVWFIAGCGS